MYFIHWKNAFSRQQIFLHTICHLIHIYWAFVTQFQYQGLKIIDAAYFPFTVFLLFLLVYKCCKKWTEIVTITEILLGTNSKSTN